MASPRVVVFPIFDAATKAPLVGQTPVFAYYADDTGGALLSPSITEVGGGFYKFTPTLVANQMIVYMLNCGPGADPQYQYDTIRAEDFDQDLIGDLVTNVSTIAAAISTVSSDVWEALRSSHLTVGSIGELMQTLWLVFTGHVKLDPTAGTFTVYGPDETVYQVQDIKNAAGAPGGLDATERFVATSGR